MFVCTDVAILRQCLLGAPIGQFGLVVELTVKVIAEQEVDIKGGTIQMLARNTRLIILCDRIRLLSGSISSQMQEKPCESSYYLYNKKTY